jgi:hypothetical protein
VAWTADDLLNSVKRRAQLPSANGKLSDADILEIADEEIQTTIAEVVREAREELWVKWTDLSITDGQRDYRIPQRAQGANLREVKLVDSSNNFYDLPRIDLERIDYYRDGSDHWWPNGAACAVVGDFIRIAPDPSSFLATYTIRLYYYRRPSKLVQTTDDQVSEITVVNSSTSFKLDDVSGLNSGQDVDFVQDHPNFDSLGDDIQITNISGSDIDVGTAPHSDVAAGDYVCDPGLAPVPQIPAELHPLLRRATLVSVLEAIGSSGSFIRVAQEKLGEMKRSATRMIQNRIEGAPPPILNWNSPLRDGLGEEF